MASLDPRYEYCGSQFAISQQIKDNNRRMCSLKTLPSLKPLLRRNNLIPLNRSIERRMTSPGQANKTEVLQALRQLDTAAICDADKIVISQLDDGETYNGIKLLQPNMRPINGQSAKHVMVGTAKTAQCTQRNDFLAVLRGLMEAEKGDILMVDTCDSDRAVAGELFCLQAIQKELGGIIINGPVRDTVWIQELSTVRCYSTSVTPYSGATQSPGTIDVPITCGGVTVDPGDIVVGDNDGVVVASLQTFETVLPVAKALCDGEAKIKEGMLKGRSLKVLTNYEEHIAARLAGNASSLGFTV